MMTQNQDNKYRSRRFGLAVASWISITIALFTGFMSGGEYVAGIGMVLAGYGFSRMNFIGSDYGRNGGYNDYHNENRYGRNDHYDRFTDEYEYNEDLEGM